jgi:hypothetical protein
MSFNMNVTSNDDFGEFFDAATSTSEAATSTGDGTIQKPSYVSQQSVLTDADSTEVSGFGDFVDAYSGLEGTSNHGLIMKPADGIMHSNGSALDNDPFASITSETIQQPYATSFVSIPAIASTPTLTETTINIQTVDVSESSNEFGDFVEVSKTITTSSAFGIIAAANTTFGVAGSQTAIELDKIPIPTQSNGNLSTFSSVITPNAIDQNLSDDPFAALGPAVDAPIPTIIENFNNEQDIELVNSTNGTSLVNGTSENLHQPSASSGLGMHDPFGAEVINKQSQIETTNSFDVMLPAENIVIHNIQPMVSYVADIKAVTDVKDSYNGAQTTTENDDFDEFGDFVAPTTTAYAPDLDNTNFGGVNGMQQQGSNGISTAGINLIEATTSTRDTDVFSNTTPADEFGDFVDINGGASHTVDETISSNAVVPNEYNDPFASIATEANQPVEFPSQLQSTTVSTPGEQPVTIQIVDVSESSNDFGDFVEVTKTATNSSAIDAVTTTSLDDVQSNTALETDINSELPLTYQSTGYAPELSPYTSEVTHQVTESTQLDDPFAALGPTNNAPLSSAFFHESTDQDFMIPNPSDPAPFVNATNENTYEPSASVGIGIHEPLGLDMMNHHQAVEKNNSFDSQLIETYNMDTKVVSNVSTSHNAAQITTEDDFDEFGDFVAPTTTSIIANSAGVNGNGIQDIYTNDIAIHHQGDNAINSDIDIFNYNATAVNVAEADAFAAVSNTNDFVSMNGNLMKTADGMVDSNVFASNDDNDPFASIITEEGQSADSPSYIQPVVGTNTIDDSDDMFRDFETVPAPSSTSIFDELTPPNTGGESGENESTLTIETEDKRALENATNGEIRTTDSFMYDGIKSAEMEPSNGDIVNIENDPDEDFGDFNASPATQVVDGAQNTEYPLQINSDMDPFSVPSPTGSHMISAEVDYFADCGTSEAVVHDLGRAPSLSEKADEDDFGDFDAAPIAQLTEQSANGMIHQSAPGNSDATPEIFSKSPEADEEDDFGTFSVSKDAVLDPEQPPKGSDLQDNIDDGFGDFDSALVNEPDVAMPQIVENGEFNTFDAAQTALVVDSLQPKTLDLGGIVTSPELIKETDQQISVQAINVDSTAGADGFGDFNTLEDTTSVLTSNKLEADDGFGDFGTVQVSHTEDPSHPDVPSETAIEADPDFGDFDAAPMVTEQEVPVQTTDYQNVVSTDDDHFGDFDEACPISTVTQLDAQNSNEGDNDFGDFDAAPGIVDHEVIVQTTDSPNAESAGDDDFGDFDAAPATSNTSQDSTQSKTGGDDEFVGFDSTTAMIDQEVPVPSADVRNIEIADDDDFGDFDAALPISTVTQQATQNTTDDDDDFGDFDAAPMESAPEVQSTDVANDNFGEFDSSPPKNEMDDDDDFGDFDAAPSEQVVPSSVPINVSDPVQNVMNDPILNNIRTVMPSFFAIDEGYDAEVEETNTVLETNEKSIEELLVRCLKFVQTYVNN